MSSIKNELTLLFSNWPDIFNRLFIKNEAVEFPLSEVRHLLQARILTADANNCMQSHYKIYRRLNSFFLVDFKNLEPDQVFSPYDEETNICAPFYIDPIQKNERILELGTGCGLYGILAAQKYAQVTAIDINKKAIAYARRNAEINLDSTMIAPCYHVSDARAFFNQFSEQYDLIIASLPYMPCPPSHQNKKIYADAGMFGNEPLQRAIHAALHFLKPQGRFKTYTMSLGDRTIAQLEKECLPALESQGWSFKITRLYKDPPHFPTWYKKQFPIIANDTAEWLQILEDKHCAYMHYLLVEIGFQLPQKCEIELREYNYSIPYRCPTAALQNLEKVKTL